MFVIGLMFVYGKFSTVITVQTIFCCNPNETVPVLIYLINQTTGEFFVSSELRNGLAAFPTCTVVEYGQKVLLLGKTDKGDKVLEEFLNGLTDNK